MEIPEEEKRRRRKLLGIRKREREERRRKKSKREREKGNTLMNDAFPILLKCEKESQAQNFISFVDYALDHSTCSKIKKLQLDFTYLCEYESAISRWLGTAVDKKVEDVVLWPGLIIDWKSLKSLKLKYIMIYDDDIVNLLSGCPVLETLEFSRFEGFRRLEMNSSNLKKLKFEEYWLPNDSDDHSLEIVAPYIQHLEISEDMHDLKCRLVNVSSVVSAKLTFRTCCTSFARFMSRETFPVEHELIMTLVQD
ncbi:putative F-box/LRR-repeat protein At5g02700 [Nicotiana sylvestris]|uniref:putative F-box/LRR-repeat protein At5g02700 n=1 Tax=Nicotiana sylvestris TaxID=4096 RepID=UPI00388CB006